MFSVLKISGVRLKILPEHKTGNIIRNMQGEYMTEAGNNYSEKKTQLHISARNLVEFIFREGDIDNRSSRAMSADAMMEGTRIHRKIQGSMGKEYQAEVPLSLVVEGDLYELTVEGRADGIFTEDGKCFVDEIKGMYRKVELFEKPVFVHRAQAMCYAYIFALQNNMETIGIQMTYCNLETEQTKYFREEFSFEEIKKWFDDLMEEYGKWATFQCEMKNQRQASIKELDFPYEYRPGQKKLVSDVYRTIMRQKLLFMQAPTGVGKTEIARRIAALTDAPFVKVEATKYTEVGYVGRDVESMVRDLAEEAVRLEKKKASAAHGKDAEEAAVQKIGEIMWPVKKQETRNPMEIIFGERRQEQEAPDPEKAERREAFLERIRRGELDDRTIEIEVKDKGRLSGMGDNENMNQLSQMLSSMMPKQTKKKNLPKMKKLSQKKSKMM